MSKEVHFWLWEMVSYLENSEDAYDSDIYFVLALVAIGDNP